MRIALFCIMAERTKHKHEQRSFRFLTERHNTLANGTLAKRFVGETTVHRPERGFFPLPIFPRALMFIAVFLAVFIGIPRFNKEIFFLPPQKDSLADVSQAPRFDEGLAMEMPLSVVKLKGCPWHTLLDALKGGKVNTFYSLFCSQCVQFKLIE